MYSADGTCILVISPENEARWYLDAGAYGTAAGHDDLPQVQCPITIGVGGKREAPVDYLAIEGIKQAPRCPKGRSDRWVCQNCSVMCCAVCGSYGGC